ncbi:MAG: ABC transporter ATP-binding protein [Burkholderiaceae bacterium]
MTAMLSVQSVCTDIGRYQILHDVDLEVPEGGVFVLLGRNGAGKTTLLRTLMGLWRPRAGQILLRGQPVHGLHASAIARRGVAYVPENMGIFGGLTVHETLLLATRSGRLDPARLAWVLELFPALETFWLQPAGTLSGGQKQMLAIARAIIEPRDLILIDEPTKGLAPAIIARLVEVFREVAKQTTVLLVEQNFLFAQALGRSVAVIDNGRIVHTGSMQALADDEPLLSRLLSLSLAPAGQEGGA